MLGKIFFVILEDLIQDGVQRQDQKSLQGLIDQTEPLHLADHVKCASGSI